MRKLGWGAGFAGGLGPECCALGDQPATQLCVCVAQWARLAGGPRVWPSPALCFLQPSLLCSPAPGLEDGSGSGLSDSAESVFSGLEDSGSDSSEESSESEDGASSGESHGGPEKTSGQQVQVGERGPGGSHLHMEVAQQEAPGLSGGAAHSPLPPSSLRPRRPSSRL